MVSRHSDDEAENSITVDRQLGEIVKSTSGVLYVAARRPR
jgi:hypothetical protein